MRVRFQSPIYHEDCYECGGHWALQWPVRRLRKLTSGQMATARFFTDFTTEMNADMAGAFTRAAMMTAFPAIGETIHIPSFDVASLYGVTDGHSDSS